MNLNKNYYDDILEQNYAKECKHLPEALAKYVIESKIFNLSLRQMLSRHYNIPIPSDSEEVSQTQ